MHRKHQEKIIQNIISIYIRNSTIILSYLKYFFLSISSVYFHSEYCIVLFLFQIDGIFIITVPVTQNF